MTKSEIVLAEDNVLYDAVLLIGPNHPKDIIDQVTAAYARARSERRLNVHIIGDGVRYIATQELNAIKHKVGSRTRIDIWGHGHVSKDGHHRIYLFKDETIPIQAVFETLHVIIKGLKEDQEINVNGLEKGYETKSSLGPMIHVWSCKGGSARYAYEALPQGSFLFLHAPKTESTMIQSNGEAIIKAIGRFDPSLDPFHEFALTLMETVTTVRFKALVNGTVLKYTASYPKQPSLTPESIRFQRLKALDEFYEKYYDKITLSLNDFHDQLAQLGYLDISYFAGLLERYMIDQMDLHNSKTVRTFFSSTSRNLMEPVFFKAALNILEYCIRHNRTHDVKFFLEKGINPNGWTESYPNKPSPLMLAIDQGNKPMVELLLSYKAESTLSKHSGASPLYNALYTHQWDIAVLLNNHMQRSPVRAARADQSIADFIVNATCRKKWNSIEIMLDHGIRFPACQQVFGKRLIDIVLESSPPEALKARLPRSPWRPDLNIPMRAHQPQWRDREHRQPHQPQMSK